MRRGARHGRRRLAVFVLAWALAAVVPALAQDADSDGIVDELDDCLERPNPLQRNDDHDRFGNACDGDLNQDGVTDDADRMLLLGEVASGDPRPVADLDESGTVDAADLEHFDTLLAGLPPGPAGSRAHDEDGDGLLDVCRRSAYELCLESCSDDFWTCHDACDPDGLPFRHRRDPVLQPDLLTNGGFDAPPPDGWSEPSSTYLGYAAEVGRAAAGSMQWLAWGGAGRGGETECRSSCIMPEPIAVEPGRTYAFSFFACVAEFPPALMTLDFLELDAGGTPLGSAGPLNTSKVLNSVPGTWEENLFYYRPARAEARFVRPRLFRKSGATASRGALWADDAAFWALDESGTRTRRSPPSAKRPFDGARTRVDALGNFEVFDGDTWQPFFPLAVYADFRRDGAAYSDAGFNVVMNERGFGVEASPGIDAVSAFNPDGMRFMFLLHSWNDTPEGTLQLEDALQNLRTRTSPERGIRLWDHLFAFNYDNEIFSLCGREDPDTGQCVERMWSAQEEPIAQIFAADREENGGVRGVPAYFLHGNAGVARAYASPESAVNAAGDPRCDVTGTYGAADLVELQHGSGQLAPATTTQIQTHVGELYRATAWGGIALGAKMIGTWRDWDPSRGSHGQLYKAPRLDLCGTTDLGLATRENFFAAPGARVRGADSGAVAELLSGPIVRSCSTGGEGAAYEVHLRAGALRPGELLLEDATDLPLEGASVDSVSGSPIVDYEIGVTERSWYAQLPALRSEIDALLPVIRATHLTEWAATFRATDATGTVVPHGDDGLLAGPREEGDARFLILANARHVVDPAGAWDAQRVPLPLDVSVSLDGLPRPLAGVRRFDFGALAFGALEPATGDGLALSMEPLEVAVLELVLKPPPPSGASEVAEGLEPHVVMALAPDLRTVTLRYDPACHAEDHAVASGPLDAVSTHGYDAVSCALGTSGTATIDVGAGDRFWLVIGHGALHQGTAGWTSAGAERPSPGAALGCFRDPGAGTCP